MALGSQPDAVCAGPYTVAFHSPWTASMSRHPHLGPSAHLPEAVSEPLVPGPRAVRVPRPGRVQYVVLTAKPELGLDLRGGTQIVLETSDSPTVKAGKKTTDKALEVLRRRIDALGVSEPSVTRQGEKRIIVELPGVQDPREAAKVIGKTAQLTFHEVLDQVADEAGQTGGGRPLPAERGRRGVLQAGQARDDR